MSPSTDARGRSKTRSLSAEEAKRLVIKAGDGDDHMFVDTGREAGDQD